MHTGLDTPATLAEVAREEPADAGELAPLFLRIVEQLIAIDPAGSASHCLSPRSVRIRPGGAIEIEPQTASLMQHTVATEPKYCPPEMFSSAAPGAMEKSAAPDIYVLGFIFYEIRSEEHTSELQSHS